MRRAVTSFHRSLGGLVRPPFFADLGRGGRGRGGTEAGAAAAAVAVAAVAMAAAVGSSRERLFARPSDMPGVCSVPGDGHCSTKERPFGKTSSACPCLHVLHSTRV